VEWFEVAEDTEECRSRVNSVMNSPVGALLVASHEGFSSMELVR
jgi:hypothetical protein